MALSEKQKQALFAILAMAALGAAAFVFFFAQEPDFPSDGSEFYHRLASSGRVGFLYDVRGADERQIQGIYQCGVDIISRGRVAGKVVENIACDEGGCLFASSEGGNRTSIMTFEQAIRRFSDAPYILIKGGERPSYQFFKRHMEIYIGKGEWNGSCDISAKEG
ncbi:MAG: hypothetical protein N3G22_03625 [Candidatus Micrarchaeota archaeon]|nr:hypothetical protein [Candidatus Micrarchaeota archaeon]